MSAKIYLLKAAIKAQLVAQAGWTEDSVIIDRQGDFTRMAAVAMGAATDGNIVIIGVAAGDATEEEGLENDLTIPITIMSRAVIEPGEMPEEELWETTVQALHNFIPVYTGHAGSWQTRLRYQGFTDAPELTRGIQEIAQLARQTVFKVRFSLEPEQ